MLGKDDAEPETDADLPSAGRPPSPGPEALWPDLGVEGPLDVSVDRDASEAEGASVALSAVEGRLGFFSDERAGGGGRRIGTAEPAAEAGRE